MKTIDVYRPPRDRWDRVAWRMSAGARVSRWRGYLLAFVLSLLAAAASWTEQHVLAWTLIGLEMLTFAGWFLLCRKLDRRLAGMLVVIPFDVDTLNALGKARTIWGELPPEMQAQTRWLLDKTYDAAALAEGGEAAVGRRLRLFQRFADQTRRETMLRQVEALGDDDVMAAEATLTALDEFRAGRLPEVRP